MKMSWGKEGRKNKKPKGVGQTDEQTDRRVAGHCSGTRESPPSGHVSFSSPVPRDPPQQGRPSTPERGPRTAVLGQRPPGPDRWVPGSTLPPSLQQWPETPGFPQEVWVCFCQNLLDLSCGKVPHLKIDCIDWKLLKTIKWAIIVMFYVVLDTVLITKYTRSIISIYDETSQSWEKSSMFRTLHYK